jgi:hypothetical protein
MSKTTITLNFNLEDHDENERFKLITKLIANPYKISSVLSRFHSELIRPSYKHGYSDSTLEALSQKDGAYELINLLWEKYYEIIKEEGMEEFLE